MNIKNIIGLLSLIFFVIGLVMRNYDCLMVMMTLVLTWFGLDIYQNTIEEWR